MNTNAIEIKNLYITSGNRYLLKNINWNISYGDNWLLFGENGCGKTTLLSTIAGFHLWAQGELKIFGKEYKEDNIFDLRKQIGWVSSSFFDKYFHEERAVDIVLSGLFGSLSKQFEISNDDIQKAYGLMELFNLRNKIERNFDSISKGERQNVLLARALISDPKILILDEPGSGLDVFAREKMLEIIEKIAQKKDTTVIYVTHYPEEILPIFDKCTLMKKGMFFNQGFTNETLTDEIMSSFIGRKVRVEKRYGKFF